MTTTNIDAIAKQAVAIFTAIEKDKGFAKQTRDANKRSVEQLRPLLQQVWDALEAGQPVQGCTTKEEWAKRFANTTMRNIQYILTGGNPNRDSKTANLDKAKHVIVGGVKYKIKSLGLDFFPKCETFTVNIVPPDEQTAAPQPKKAEQKKPIKHAKNPKTYTAWCRTSLKFANTAHQSRYATCPFCIAAMKAGVPVVHPEVRRRALEKELEEARGYLAQHESIVQNCLPEHRDKKNSGYRHSIEAIPEYGEEIAKLERELAAIKEIKTPEQAVEAAQKAAAQREAERLEEANREPLHAAAEALGETLEAAEPMPALADGRKEYEKRYREVKHRAKHYIEMFKEYETLRGIDADPYAALREMYPDGGDRCYGGKPLDLEPTEKGFLAAHDAACDLFDKTLKEGTDKGWMTMKAKAASAGDPLPVEEALWWRRR